MSYEERKRRKCLGYATVRKKKIALSGIQFDIFFLYFYTRLKIWGKKFSAGYSRTFYDYFIEIERLDKKVRADRIISIQNFLGILS